MDKTQPDHTSNSPAGLCVGTHANVPFALADAEVVILASHVVADGETIYHVSDVSTGHQDFVGEKWITHNIPN